MIEVKRVETEDDIRTTVDAIASTSWSEKSEINPSDYSVENLQKCILNKHHIFCMAIFDGQFAGMASAFKLEKPTGNAWLYIDEVDVCADKQKNGVGTAMMEFLFEYAQAHGCDEVWLGTEKDNIAANALYQSVHPSKKEEFVGYTYKIK